MGLYLKGDFNQKWNSAKVEPDEQNFSLTGRIGQFSSFQGLIYKPGDPATTPMAISEETFDPEPETEIRHEGSIIGNYLVHGIGKTCFTVWFGYVPISFHIWFPAGGEKPLQNYYAYQGDEEPEVNLLMAILGDVISGVGSYGASGFGEISKSIMTQASGGGLMGAVKSIFGDKSGFGAFGGQVMGPSDVEKYFPSGFRPISRAAVRRFPNLKAALWKKNKLLMDGVFWIDQVQAKKDFKYIGKGYIATSDGFVSQAPSLKKVSPEKEKRDFLNIFIESLNPGGEGLKIEATEISASIYSKNGVLPSKDGFNLLGNLITSNIYKENLEHDMNVIYWNDKLDLTEEEYSNWMVMSLSPKIEAFSQSIKRLGGSGDDGVSNIVEDL